jgi:hypothetical protein
MLEMVQHRLQMMQPAHWLIVAGCALVILGIAGILIRTARTPEAIEDRAEGEEVTAIDAEK